MGIRVCKHERTIDFGAGGRGTGPLILPSAKRGRFIVNVFFDDPTLPVPEGDSYSFTLTGSTPFAEWNAWGANLADETFFEQVVVNVPDMLYPQVVMEVTYNVANGLPAVNSNVAIWSICED